MGLRSGKSEYESPLDRVSSTDQAGALPLELLLFSKTDEELARMFPGIGQEQFALLRKEMNIPSPKPS